MNLLLLFSFFVFFFFFSSRRRHTRLVSDWSSDVCSSDLTQRLPQTDNNTTGLLSNGFGGPGFKNNGRFGYRLYTPDQFFSETVNQDKIGRASCRERV